MNIYGRNYFDIDLLLCQVRLGETTYGDISNNQGKYRNIKELGQDIPENTYMIKAYLYGKHQETDNNGNIRRFLVFKYKEPADYAENSNEDKNNYKQYQSGTTNQIEHFQVEMINIVIC